MREGFVNELFTEYYWDIYNAGLRFCFLKKYTIIYFSQIIGTINPCSSGGVFYLFHPLYISYLTQFFWKCYRVKAAQFDVPVGQKLLALFLYVNKYYI